MNKLTLTAKDEEILNLRRSGLTLKEIACKVFLSNHILRHRLAKLRGKAGAKNDIELIEFCHKNSLFSEKAA